MSGLRIARSSGRLERFPGVAMRVWPLVDGLAVQYRGRADDLIAAGVATAELLQPGRRGLVRRDDRGVHYRRDLTGGGGRSITRYFDDTAMALEMPGVRDLVCGYGRQADPEPDLAQYAGIVGEIIAKLAQARN